jgi:hypothetical protein
LAEWPAELEEIERAAKVLETGMRTTGWGTPGVHEAFDVIESIAKEAT